MKKGLIYILVTAVVFTTLEPVSKLISTQINPIAITFLRFFIGGSILLPFSFMAIKKRGLVLDKYDYFKMSALGILCICISMVLLQYAVLKADSPALIAIIFSSNSVFTILFAGVILKDKITVRKFLAVGLCLAGVLICADLKSSTNMLSVVLVVASSLTFSLYTVLSKKFAQKVNGIVQTGISFFAGSLVLLVVLLVTRVEVISPLDGGNILHILYLGIMVTGLGYWSYFKAMEKASAVAASVVFFIKPILTPFAAFFINGIMPQGKVFIALVLVLVGSYLATINPLQKQKN